jgi:hypothetical protein
MLKPVLILVAGVLLLPSAPVVAADYGCAQKEIGTRLNDSDIEIKKREGVVAEIKAEIQESGGSTDQHKKALEAFEEKLAKAKATRETLLKECNGKSAP